MLVALGAWPAGKPFAQHSYRLFPERFEMTEQEKLEAAQLQITLGNKAAYSLKAAASEVLGSNTEKFNNYFQIHSCILDDEPGIAVVEKLTGQEYKIALSYKILQEDSDETYYMELKRLAKLVLPFIPPEELKIPKDEWPEPQWKEPN